MPRRAAPVAPAPSYYREESGRFLKKAAQKLSLCRSREVLTPVAQGQKSLFGSFSSEKELLARYTSRVPKPLLTRSPSQC
jgi:hypothetical protein